MPAPDAMLTMAPPPWSTMWRAAHLAADHDAEQVDGHHPFEVAHVVVEEPAEAPRHPGDVAHDLEPAEAFDGERDELLDLGGVGHVGLLEGGMLTEVARHLSRRRSASTSAMTTSAPSATKRSAVTRPIPLAPPVTMATLPASSPATVRPP